MKHSLNNIVEAKHKGSGRFLYQLVKKDTNNRILSVISSNSKCKKNDVIFSLIYSIISSGLSVLLIDTTCCSSGTYNLLFSKRKSSVKLYEPSMNSIDIAVHSTPYRNLYFLGFDNNSCILWNKFLNLQMCDFLNSSRTKYDYIIFNTPLFSSFPYSLSISELCDTSIIVAEENKTKHEELSYVLRILKKSGIDVSAVALINDKVLSKQKYYSKKK